MTIMNSPSNAFGVRAGLIIPGRGEPIRNGVVLVKDKVILFVGLIHSLPKEYDDIPVLYHVPVLLPGLWDCHVHFCGQDASGGGTGSMLVVNPILAGARTARDLAATLNAGFTSVREVAGYGIDVQKAVEEGTIPGPHIYSSAWALSQTGGHGDAHETPLDIVHSYMHKGACFHLCDGVDECVKAVRSAIRKGAKLIKVCASGGVTSELDNPQDAQFSEAELKAIVEEAARARRSVAAHCHGKKGIMNALNAGVLTIEHGTYADEEVFDLMKEKGAILVATRSIAEGLMADLDLLPPASQKKMIEVFEIHRKMYAAAVKSGVKIALGTDLGISADGYTLSHGRNGKELYFATKAGMSPLEAIEAATATAPETLGELAPKSGFLKAGYAADIIALSANPLQDIRIFEDPKKVTHVWKEGKLFKGTYNHQ